MAVAALVVGMLLALLLSRLGTASIAAGCAADPGWAQCFYPTGDIRRHRGVRVPHHLG